MTSTKRVRWFGLRMFGALIAAVAAMLAFPLTGSAQCIMCSLAVASTGEHGMHVFQAAILVAAAPIFLMFGGIMLLAYLRREPVAQVDEDAIDELPEPDLPAALSLDALGLTHHSSPQS